MDETEGAAFTSDPYAGWTENNLRKRCRELSRAVSRWQMIALVAAYDGIGALTEGDRAALEKLKQAYSDVNGEGIT